MKNEVFIGGIDPQEIADVLHRIDENINMRSVLGFGKINQDIQINIPDLNSTIDRIHHLYHLSSPFYSVYGSPAKRIVRWLLNVPLRVFARRQAYYNRESLQISAEIANHAQSLQIALTHLSQRIDRLVTTVDELRSIQESLQRDLQEKVENARIQIEQVAAEQRGHQAWLEQVAAEQRGHQAWLEQVAAEQRGHQAWLEQVAAEQRGHQAWLEQVAAEQRGHQAWLEQVAANQQGMHDWVTILQRKHEMLALDVREDQQVRVEGPLPEPRVVDDGRYQQRLASIGGVRLNLGCGEKPLDNYINVDIRPVPGVDIVADARSLPYEPGSVDEIASSHLIEHFREHQLRTQILPYWKRLLKPGGYIRIICPNWEVIVEYLNQGRISWEEFKYLTFGAQDYIGDDHFAMYTPKTLRNLLIESGFHQVEILAVDRLNGMCPEMELVAYADNNSADGK